MFVNNKAAEQIKIANAIQSNFRMLIIYVIWAASWQNQQNGMCAQRRFRSAISSAQSDQSFRCSPEENLGP